MTPLDHALYYAARGWRVAPIPPGHKYPEGMPAWQRDATTDEATIRRWWTTNPGHGVSIVTGLATGHFVLDVDPRHGGDDTLADLEHEHGPLPDTIEVLTGGGGRHLHYRIPPGVTITNDAGKRLGPGLDIRGEGGQVVAPPTIHPDTGQPYTWELQHDPFDGLNPADPPDWLIHLLTVDLTPLTPRRPARTKIAASERPGDRYEHETQWADLLTTDGWTLHSARRGRAGDYELWTRPGKHPRNGASASLYYQGSDVLKVFTSSVPGLTPDATYSRFGYYAATRHGNDHTAAARELGRRFQNLKGDTMTVPGVELVEASETGNAVRQFPFTDLGNARRLVHAHGTDLRYAPQFGAWLAWDGHRWREDITGETQRRAKAVVDSMVTEIATIESSDERKRMFQHWTRSQGSGRLEAMVQVARTEPGIPVTVAELDADPWLLNTLGGVIDLRTGELSPAGRDALVTKLAPVDYDPTSTCPTWDAFVDWAMCGDTEMVTFLQRAVGYSLTGLVTEQCLFFAHGHGENGKSTFLTTIGTMLGDYAIAAEPDLLIASPHERHTTGIADLVGRRLAVVQETDEGRRLAESTVKQLTGGDTIRARRMRQDNFEFRPSHKLWMAANHRPVVRGTDHAIWRRIRLIPFTATLAPGQRDDHLGAKLELELPGILNWALRGCQAWREGGMRPPATVIEATGDYRSEQDHVGRFIDDCCILGDEWCLGAKPLRDVYEEWCEENGERPWSAKAMAPQLRERGCERVQAGTGKLWTWVGITLADRPEKPTPQMLLARMATTNGPRPMAMPIPAADAALSNGPRPADELPAETPNAAHRGLSTRSPYARARAAGDTDDGPQGPRALDDTNPEGQF